MGPSTSVIEESNSLFNNNEDSRDQFAPIDHKKGKIKSTMNSIDNSMQGFQHYQRNLI